MGNLVNKIVASKFWWVILLVILLAVNYLASSFHARFDLTKEKRYTLTKASKDLLKKLDGEVQIDVFLKGDFPAGFKKLANSTEEFLGLLKDRNSSKIHYRFISPQEEMPDSRKTYGDSLVGLGAIPINLTVQKEEGESSNIIFPVALMRYKGKQSLVSLYPRASGAISQDEINSAEALMEYQFVKTLDKMMEAKAPGIVYAMGNGQPTDLKAYDIEQTLTQDYRFGPVDISTNQIPGEADVLLIVKPTIQFTEDQKLKIDQYIMRGGKVLWFIDNLIAEQDSLRYTTETIAFDRDLNLTDQLFRYGVRINPDLVMSLDCDYMPFAVGGTQENPQFEFLKWNYYPLFGTSNNNPVTKNMGLVKGRFVNSIDTIATPGITKTVLLSSSPNSRIISTPALISLNENKNAPQDAKFTKSNIPVAMLLEGKFTSLFRNKISKSQLDSLSGYGAPFMEMSKEPGKMIVVGDGDILLNEVSPKEGPLPMGTNFYTMGSQYEYQFANKDFLQNCIEYLVNKPGINETRSKDIVLRLLDSQKVKAQKSTWQFMNIALPILLVLLAGWIYQQVRKRKYAA